MPQCSVGTRNVATLAMIYTGACVVYLVLTRNVGTPFYDSLTEEQRTLKTRSARVRGNVFLQSLGLSAMVVLCRRPFST